LQVFGAPVITNISAVIEVVQPFTSVPVQVSILGSNTTLRDIVREVNSFDILLTTSGAHIAAAVFSLRPYTKGIMELVPFSFDSFYYRSFHLHGLNFGEYLVSTGHLTTGVGSSCAFFNTPTAFKERNCTRIHHSFPKRFRQERIVCPEEYMNSLACDVQVQQDLLRKHFGLLLWQSLCKWENPSISNVTSRWKKFQMKKVPLNFTGANADLDFKKYRPTPLRTELATNPKYPLSHTFSYQYYRVWSSAQNISGNRILI